ncbi:CsgG/HfaB family protein [Trichlorobacter lovleyi]|uniref:Type IV secretion system putative lipoprotein virB7 n=1 Tax=Trichlorobacter lovleyi (strain ATCC BAA-1151 / DSM 17278 / SZ) TaxID=398767 RepID=B3E9Y8_TRIL1|nr:CsgG/HfaB family protein [Trichlorobacter lovleyi]ACD96863.1 Tetratricopeptide TPR_2 repeat protein [Trichlorobacter lovleyi SZ]
MKRILLVLGIVVLLTGCNNPGKESFELGRQLERQGRVDEAITLYEDAIVKEQDNQEYRAVLASARSGAAARFVEQGHKRLQGAEITYDQLRTAQLDVDKALKADPHNNDAKVLASSVKSQMDALLKRAEALYAASTKAADLKDWPTAINKLREIRQFYPGYLDLMIKLPQTENAALGYYLKQAEQLRTADDLDAMIVNLEQALAIQPANQQIAGLLKDAKVKNTASVWFGKAEQSAKQGKWLQVAGYLGKAELLSPDQVLQTKMTELRRQGAQKMLQQGMVQTSKKQFYTAYLSLQAGRQFSPAFMKEAEAADLRKQLAADMAAKSQEMETTGLLGNAWYWLDLSIRLGGGDRESQQRLQTLKDRLRQRVVKKIAVMDFSPPTNSTDAGKLVTDSLLSYMTKNASSDVKILARDVLGAIIKEIEFGQAGLYDIESAKKTGKLKGTDIFIFGSVLQYNVEKSAEEGSKMVNVVVATKQVPNPAYQSWLLSHPSPNEKEMALAPPALMKEEIRETVKYKVGTHKKTANVALSFRVIDVESGEVVITTTIKSRKEAEDKFSEGVEFANIPFDPMELPSDAVLLEKAVDEGIAELGRLVLTRFQNRQASYLQAAELLSKKGGGDQVVERYMDAIVAEEVKHVASQVTSQAKLGIEQYLQSAEQQ